MTDDPFDSAENPEIKLPGYWGQVDIKSYFCVLQKGTGKVAFDPNTHSQDQRRTAIDITIYPIPEQNVTYTVSRSMVAESREWAGMVLPSIKALGLSLRELHGRFVHVSTKGLGSTYTNAQGERKERTTLVFDKIFANEADCKQDYLMGGLQQTQSSPAAQAPAGSNGNGVDKEKQTAASFLKAVVTNACRGKTDLKEVHDLVATQIAGMPLISKYFTADSPETATLIMESMAK